MSQCVREGCKAYATASRPIWRTEGDAAAREQGARRSRCTNIERCTCDKSAGDASEELGGSAIALALCVNDPRVERHTVEESLYLRVLNGNVRHHGCERGPIQVRSISGAHRRHVIRRKLDLLPSQHLL